MSNRRSLTSLVQRAIDSGRHRVDIQPDGRITILPSATIPDEVGDAALDAEIRDLMAEYGHASH